MKQVFYCLSSAKRDLADYSIWNEDVGNPKKQLRKDETAGWEIAKQKEIARLEA